MVNRRRPDALHRRLEHAVARVGGELTACRLCRGIEFAELRDFARLPRVSSDCRPWPAGGRLVVCRACGMPQSAIDSEGRAELAAIYRDYSLNAPWGGREVAVRADPRGAMERRSAGLMRRLATEVRLPARGQALDIGCGTGAMLAAFGEHRGGWRLHGHDLDTRNARLLAALPGFAMLHTGAISAVPGRFDLVTLSHSLEHMLDPRAVLADIVGRLAPRGRLFVQVPDWHANPWDLVVADHVAHFDAVTLPELMASAGFACRIVAAWAPRELSALAVKAGRADPPALDPGHAARSIARLERRIAWMERLIERAREVAGRARRLGVFGTAVGGSWLMGALDGRAQFFVDEDPSRVGTLCHGLPVLAPGQVADRASVLVPLPPAVARLVVQRHRRLEIDWHLPPPVPRLRERGRLVPALAS